MQRQKLSCACLGPHKGPFSVQGPSYFGSLLGQWPWWQASALTRSTFLESGSQVPPGACQEGRGPSCPSDVGVWGFPVHTGLVNWWTGVHTGRVSWWTGVHTGRRLSQVRWAKSAGASHPWRGRTRPARLFLLDCVFEMINDDFDNNWWMMAMLMMILHDNENDDLTQLVTLMTKWKQWWWQWPCKTGGASLPAGQTWCVWGRRACQTHALEMRYLIFLFLFCILYLIFLSLFVFGIQDNAYINTKHLDIPLKIWKY